MREALVYLAVLIIHSSHIIEELLYKADFITTSYGGTTNFLLINVALLCIPIILLYYALQRKRWALLTSMVYAAIIILDGIVHIAQWTISKTPSESAGIITGIGFVIIGLILLYSLGATHRTERSAYR